MLTCQIENKELISQCLKENILPCYFRKVLLEAFKMPSVTFPIIPSETA